MSEKPALPLRIRLGFGIGDLGGNLFFTIMGFYLLIYLTDTVNLAAGRVPANYGVRGKGVCTAYGVAPSSRVAKGFPGPLLPNKSIPGPLYLDKLNWIASLVGMVKQAQPSVALVDQCSLGPSRRNLLGNESEYKGREDPFSGDFRGYAVPISQPLQVATKDGDPIDGTEAAVLIGPPL